MTFASTHLPANFDPYDAVIDSPNGEPWLTQFRRAQGLFIQYQQEFDMIRHEYLLAFEHSGWETSTC